MPGPGLGQAGAGPWPGLVRRPDRVVARARALLQVTSSDSEPWWLSWPWAYAAPPGRRRAAAQAGPGPRPGPQGPALGPARAAAEYPGLTLLSTTVRHGNVTGLAGLIMMIRAYRGSVA